MSSCLLARKIMGKRGGGGGGWYLLLLSGASLRLRRMRLGPAVCDALALGVERERGHSPQGLSRTMTRELPEGDLRGGCECEKGGLRECWSEKQMVV